jgi:tricorn protease-like protein
MLGVARDNNKIVVEETGRDRLGEHNIKMCIREVDCERVKLIECSQHRVLSDVCDHGESHWVA